jgi:hypothetical protein
MDLKTALTLFVTVCLALTGYFYTLFLARRKDRLDRINCQLSDLYGPLYALSKTGDHVWLSFRSRHRPYLGSFWADSLVSDTDAEAFRLWIRSVFMPLNRQMVDLVVNRADLLEGTKIPECLLELCAHVSSYEALLRQWEKGDFTAYEPIVNFPGHDLLKYAEQEFCRLKQEQDTLLRTQRISIPTRKRNRDASSGSTSAMGSVISSRAGLDA